jgi:hypothetical protein
VPKALAALAGQAFVYVVSPHLSPSALLATKMASGDDDSNSVNRLYPLIRRAIFLQPQYQNAG